jgi:hypothetical protein
MIAGLVVESWATGPNDEDDKPNKIGTDDETRTAPAPETDGGDDD